MKKNITNVVKSVAALMLAIAMLIGTPAAAFADTPEVPEMIERCYVISDEYGYALITESKRVDEEGYVCMASSCVTLPGPIAFAMDYDSMLKEMAIQLDWEMEAIRLSVLPTEELEKIFGTSQYKDAEVNEETVKGMLSCYMQARGITTVTASEIYEGCTHTDVVLALKAIERVVLMF